MKTYLKRGIARVLAVMMAVSLCSAALTSLGVVKPQTAYAAATGIATATKGQTVNLGPTKAPDGYNMRDDPMPVTLKISNSYTSMPVADGMTPVELTERPSGLYNWTQKAALSLDAPNVMRTTAAYGFSPGRGSKAPACPFRAGSPFRFLSLYKHLDINEL